MTDEFMGPPWQMDWTLKAQAARDALPEHVRKMTDADVDLPDGIRDQPARASDPRGPVEEIFWQ
ncbi:hypothetical protein [Streptomyces antibioticus]|uniref:hypothetical protein n=1 Tax=Streptomyces antibioticus TaxID=1890 RepID=UPI0033B89F34